MSARRVFVLLLCLLSLVLAAAGAQAQGEDPQESAAPAALADDPREQRPLDLTDAGLPAADREAAGLPAVSPGRYLLSVVVWLAVCAGLIWLLAAFMRVLYRRMPGGSVPLLLEPLGSVPLGPGATLYVVRLDEELLLLGGTSGSVTLLARISDPERVARFARAFQPALAAHPSGFAGLLRKAQQRLGGPVPPPPRLDGATLFGPDVAGSRPPAEPNVWLIGEEAVPEVFETGQDKQALLEALGQALREQAAARPPLSEEPEPGLR